MSTGTLLSKVIRFPFEVATYIFGLFVFVTLWAWFAVPIFKLPPITMWQAYAIFIILGCYYIIHLSYEKVRRFAGCECKKVDEEEKEVLRWFLVPLRALFTALLWGIGALIHNFGLA